MKISSEERDSNMDRWSVWIKENAVQPKPDFLFRVRQRIAEEPADPAEQFLDEMLEMDPTLRNPRMVELVRQRLQWAEDIPGKRSLDWLSWLAPLAAAATLTLAFVSFQSRAPQDTLSLAAEASAPEQVATPLDDDFEATRIFALAANLHSSADMSQLQSVEALASLFD